MHSREKLVEETLSLAKKIAAQSQISAAFAKRALSQGGLDDEQSLFIGLNGNAPFGEHNG
jgi:enoyl-CoA hydratase/carnithine racemase